METDGRTDKNFHLQHYFMKSYKRNSMVLFLCFTLSITLITALLILLHTNHKMDSIQRQMLFTDADCSISRIDGGTLHKLIGDPDLKWYAVEQLENTQYQRNSQNVFLERGDDSYITLTTRLEDGRLPQEENEIAAERWTLLNMGIEPECGQEFGIFDMDGKKAASCKLVGILSDVASNKKYGVRAFYAPVKSDGADNYTVYIRFLDGINYQEKVRYICEELDIEAGKVSKCPGREDIRKLWLTDMKVIGVLLLVSMVVFYGVYRIAMMSRRNQYGILRALGMERRQLQRMIILELYEIYLAGIPAGGILGILIALLISAVSGDSSKEIYLHNETISFAPVIPVFQIAVSIAAMALLVGCAGCFTGKNMARCPVPVLISGCGEGKKRRSLPTRCFFGRRLQDGYGRNRTLFSLGNKYIWKDSKTSVFVMLTICVGVTLFTALSYQQKIAEAFREDTKEMHYLNGQYEMGVLRMNSVWDGISRECAEEIASLPGVGGVKTQAGIPVRIIDDEAIKRNETYFKKLNEANRKMEGYPLAGYDGRDQIYRSILYGYNKTALTELKKYVVAGDFDINGLKEDEIILSVLRMDNTKENKYPGNYKNGTPLMEYEPGDEIKVKYRRDFNTAQPGYEHFTDVTAEYVYKTYRVAAIVSFEYMYDGNVTVYPLLITSDEQIQKLCPDGHIQRIYIDGQASLTGEEQDMLERRLIRLGSRNDNVSTRSIISDIQNNEMFYQKQMVNIIGTAIVSFLLVLINMVNNLSYRMQIRTREICMFRAIGMSVRMIRRMMIFENMVLGMCGTILAYLCSRPILEYLYRQSDMKAFARPYRFDYAAFITIAALAILLCILLAAFLSKDWKTGRIMERMNQIE